MEQLFTPTLMAYNKSVFIDNTCVSAKNWLVTIYLRSCNMWSGSSLPFNVVAVVVQERKTFKIYLKINNDKYKYL